MNRKDCQNDKQIKYLDQVNNERLESSRKRIAHAIRILKPATWRKYKTDAELAALKTDIAHATNLLEVAAEDMEFHCEWFDYDIGVIFHINDACNNLGQAMAEMFEDKYDVVMVTADVKDACIILAKALATLIRWNDDNDVSEEV